ncbi:hypothetical protein, partial [Mesorhizobium japonicum]|uniref:hypothetical protein n=1 Tax=Mesorhizobium japonicum TaxID=2066070 RepID=UPI003B5C240E
SRPSDKASDTLFRPLKRVMAGFFDMARIMQTHVRTGKPYWGLRKCQTDGKREILGFHLITPPV